MSDQISSDKMRNPRSTGQGLRWDIAEGPVAHVAHEMFLYRGADGKIGIGRCQRNHIGGLLRPAQVESALAQKVKRDSVIGKRKAAHDIAGAVERETPTLFCPRILCTFSGEKNSSTGTPCAKTEKKRPRCSGLCCKAARSCTSSGGGGASAASCVVRSK